MPHDQFGPQSTTLHASLPAPEEILGSRTRPAGAAGTVVSAEVNSGRVAQRQEELIRRAFARSQADQPSLVPGRTYVISKRALDLIVTVPALILVSPLLLVIAIAIRLDSHGPALFLQDRVGKNGRIFKMLKFRSMTNGCSMLNGGTHKVEQDRRVTRVGRILRQTSLDELPQLINVVTGDMSLVGPRPELPMIVLEHYELWQYQRLAVPQGITGWWQVTGRGKKLLRKHTVDDLFYIEHASFWFDLKLLAMTIRAVVGRDGAF